MPADAAHHASQSPAIKVTKPKQAKTLENRFLFHTEVHHGYNVASTSHTNTATIRSACQVTKTKQANMVYKFISIMEVYHGVHLQLAIVTLPQQGLFIIELYQRCQQLLLTVICQLLQVNWQDQ